MLEQLAQYYSLIQDLFSNEVFQEYGVFGLFFNSLLSATALPIPTELLTSALLSGGESKLLIGVALLSGSVVGGVLNYVIGVGGGRLAKIIKKFIKYKKEEDKEKKTNRILEKLGWSAIFFSPFIFVIGDLILISAGAKKMNFKKFLLLMIGGKLLKTVIVIIGLGIIF